MSVRPPEDLAPREIDARQVLVDSIAREFGFIGRVEYRHVVGDSGGAQYGMAVEIKHDILVVDAAAFERAATGHDFSLEAMIAHECGHQVLCRNVVLRRRLPREMSLVTEELLASLIGAVLVVRSGDYNSLILKAIFELVEHGVPLTSATAHVYNIIGLIRAIV